MSAPACIVHVPSPLASYVHGAREVSARGATLADVLADLDARFPGMRFRMIDEHDRIRRHMRIYLNTTPAQDLSAPVRAGDAVHLICALSGG
jgi:molybdopterin converting factor small subunit